MGYKVFVSFPNWDRWLTNGMIFATPNEASDYGVHLKSRMTIQNMCVRVEESKEMPTHTFEEGVFKSLWRVARKDEVPEWH